MTSERQRAHPTKIEDGPFPASFVEFCEAELRVRLFPGQRVLCLVAFDGVDPCDLEGEERELAREIFGDVDTIPAVARGVVAAMCGGRAGKTYLLGALKLLHSALSVSLASLAPGEYGEGVIVAPDLDLARQALRYAAGAARSCPRIAALIEKDNTDELALLRADGYPVAITCRAARRGGAAQRGRSLVGAVLDEAAFFLDKDSGVVNDEEVFKAMAPRVLPGGQTVIASTPWTQAGLLWDLYDRNHGSPTDAIAAHAPTLVLRNDEHTRTLVAREHARDPVNADREFGANPMPSGTAEFFNAQALRQCTVEDMPVELAPAGGTLALDTGFRKEPTSGVIVRKQGHAELFSEAPELYEVAAVVEVRPEKGVPLRPSETVRRLLKDGKRHAVHAIASDQHYVETVRENVDGMNAESLSEGGDRMRAEMIEAPAGQPGKVEMYTKARTLLHEGKVRIPAGQTRLLLQLRQVVARPLPGGGLAIVSPRRGGAHGDIASAFVLGLWAEANGANDLESLQRQLDNLRRLGAA